jgi:hypothetical protein
MLHVNEREARGKEASRSVYFLRCNAAGVGLVLKDAKKERPGISRSASSFQTVALEAHAADDPFDRTPKGAG